MKKLLCVLCAFLALCACDKRESDKTVIKIGVLYPLTGDGAFLGESAKIAAKMFFEDYANTKYKYDLIWEDSMANPATAVSAVRKLINYDHVDVVFDLYSSVGLAVSPITNENKTPHLTFAQDKNISKGFYNWRVVTPDRKTGEKMLAALQKRKLKNIVAVVENAAGNLSLYDGFKDVAKNDKNIKITEMKVNPGERDFNTLMDKINKISPDAVMTVLHSPEIDIFMRQAKTHNVRAPITGLQSFTFLKDKSLADGGWYVDVSMANQDFMTRYNKITNNAPTSFAENFYTLLLVAVTNFESFDTKPTAEEFINNLKSLNGVMAPIGELVYDPVEQNIETDASVRKVENGTVTKIEE